jgi:hypothetical protein
MPKFDFKRAMVLERSLNKYPNEICVLIGSKEDYDLKLFIVGKNLLLVDPEIVLTTNYLKNLEDHI